MCALPWDDPDRDIGADLVETTARWIAAPGRPDEQDARTAAAFIRNSFSVSDQSIGEAIRRLGRAASAATNGIGRMMDQYRHPANGGPTTREDLDVDQRRVGDDYLRLLRENPPPHRRKEGWPPRDRMEMLAYANVTT